MKVTRMTHLLLLLAALACAGCAPPKPPSQIAIVDPPSVTKPDAAAIKHVVEVVMSERGFTVDHTQRSPLAVAPLRVDLPTVKVENSPVQVAVSGLQWRVAESSATPAKDGRFSKNHCLYFGLKPNQCPPCKWVKEELFTRFKTEAKDWTIGRGDTDHIRLIDVQDDEEEVEEFLAMSGAPNRNDLQVPLFAVVSGGKVLRIHVGRDRPGGGYITPAWVTNWIVGPKKAEVPAREAIPFDEQRSRAEKPDRNRVPAVAGIVFHAGHDCPRCGRGQYVIHNQNGPVENSHVHACGACGQRWYHRDQGTSN